MLRCTVFFCALNIYFVVSAHGPKYDGSTLGRVWPRPQMQVKHKDLYTYDLQQFKVKITHGTCPLLTAAINRCMFNIKRLQKLIKKGANNSEIKTGNTKIKGPIQKLQVALTNECEEYPQLGMEEAYTLTVSAKSRLKSASIWGIIRGLETFSQLFFLAADYRQICVYKTDIHDYPRYLHRGLLIDTSRHYLSLPYIFLTIKALAINKMNVFHWHMKNDQSLPYQRKVSPKLNQKGAFNSSSVYTNKDILNVIKYARERGVRVIPEYVPSHAHSWSHAYPNITAECNRENQSNITSGTMNPINDTTYKLIGRLFHKVQTLFKDKHFHLGGAEIDFPCWESNPIINKYLKDNNLKSRDLLAKFYLNISSLLRNDTAPIVWQDVFDNGVPLNLDTIVHVWKDDTKDMLRPMLQGYQVLYSSKWYLNKSNDFDDFYRTDLRKMITNITNKAWITKLVIGGEACMWREKVDDKHLMTQVWPRTCAVAERLWSNVESHKLSIVPAGVKYRLNDHVCHMIRRGIPLNPLEGYGTCLR